MRADPVETARRVAGDAYEILGELGREGERSIAFLARENDTGHLVALTLEGLAEATRLGVKPGFSVRRALDPSVPAVESRCPRCHAAVTTWARFCPSCSTDLAGMAEAPVTGSGPSPLATAATAGKFDVLGAMNRAEGGGPVYFAREQDTGRVVALRIDTGESDGPEAAPVANVTQRLRTLRTDALADGGSSDPARAADSEAAPAPAAVPEEPGAQVLVCPSCGTMYGPGAQFCPRDGTALKTKTRSQDLAGRVIAGRYRVLARLGAGGMGQVYKAEHIRMGSLCAIKLMNPALERDPEALSRFAREAAHASRISHANIARVYDFGETQDGLLFLAMEFAEGETLSKIIARDGALPPARAAALARQVADALAAAHELGTVHRDIKPDNIIVNTTKSGRETAKVVDFGIAKGLNAPVDEQVTRAGFVVGNPKYMSPEQLIGEATDARGDVYSLGCVLFEMLTGQPAFSASGGAAQLTKRLTEPPPSPRVRQPDVPAELDAIVTRAMARDPEARFESAAAMRDALTTVVEAITTGRSRIHTDGSWMAVKPQEAPAPRPGERRARRWLEPRRLLPLAGLGVLFVAVIIQLARTGPNEPAPPDSATPAGAAGPGPAAAGGSPAAALPETATRTEPQAVATSPGREGAAGRAEPAGTGTVTADRSRPPADPSRLQADPSRVQGRSGAGGALTGVRPGAADTPVRGRVDTPSVRVRPPPEQTTRPVFRPASADSLAGLLVGVQVRAERREYPQAFEWLRSARARLDALLATFPSEASLRDLDQRLRSQTESVRTACEAWRETQLQRGIEIPPCR
jgi:serine/threonine-protein kinase